MSEKIFNEDYFSSYLQESGCLSEGKDGKTSLTKVSNINIGHVLSAHSCGTFSDQDILRWIHKGRKLTPLIEEQFLLYKRLAKCLIDYVKPEDVDAWKEILINRKYSWPTEGREGWASVFGEVPDLCHKFVLEQTEGKTSCDQDSTDDDSLNKTKLDYEEDFESEDRVELDYDEDFESEDEEVKDSVMLDLCRNTDVKQVEEGNSSNDLGNIEILNKSDSNKTETIEKNYSVDAVTKEIMNFNSRISKKEESVVKNENGEDLENIEKVENDKSEIDGFEEDFFDNDFFSDDDEDDESSKENDKDSKDDLLNKTKLDNEEDYESGNKEELDYDENLKSEDEEDKDSDILQLYAEDDFHEEIKNNEERFIHKPLNERLSFASKDLQSTREGVPLVTIFDSIDEQKKIKILEEKTARNIQVQQSEAKYIRTEICKRKIQYKKVYLVGAFASQIAQRLLLPNVIPLDVKNHVALGSKNDTKLSQILRLKPKDTLFILLINYECFNHESLSTFECKSGISSQHSKYPVAYIRMGDETPSNSKRDSNINMAKDYLQNVQNQLAPELRSTAVFAPLCPQVYFMSPNENDQKEMNAFHQTFLQLQLDRHLPLLIPSGVTPLQKAEIFCFMGQFPKHWMNFTTGILKKNNISATLFDKYPNCSQYQFASFDGRAETMKTDKKLLNMWNVLLKLFIQQILHSENESRGAAVAEMAPLKTEMVASTEKWCDLCKIYLNSEKNLIAHKAGSWHSNTQRNTEILQKIKQQKDCFIKELESSELRCLNCCENMILQKLEEHLGGVKHKSTRAGVSTSEVQLLDNHHQSLQFTRTIPPAGVPHTIAPTRAPMANVPVLGMPPKSLTAPVVQPQIFIAGTNQPSFHMNNFYNIPPTNVQSSVILPPGFPPQTIAIPQAQFQNSLQPGVSNFSHQPPNFLNSAIPPAASSQYSPNFYQPPSSLPNIAVQPSVSSQPFVHAPPSFIQPPPSHSNIGVPPSANSQSFVVGSQFSQPPPSLPKTVAVPPTIFSKIKTAFSQNKYIRPSLPSASSVPVVHSVPQIPKGINIAILRDIPKVLKNSELEKILSGCGKIYKYERRPLSSDMCSVHYHDGESTLRCKRLLHCCTLMDTKLRVDLPYEDSFTLQERGYINQGMENVATFIINQNIKKIEEEYMKKSVEIKQVEDNISKSKHNISKIVESFEKNRNDREGIKIAQKSKSKSPDIIVIKPYSKIPERKGRHSGSRETDGCKSSGSRSPNRKHRMSRSRSPSKRHRRSKSMSPNTRHRKSKSRSTDRRHRRTGRSSLDRRHRRSRSKNSDITHRKKGNRSPDRRHNRSKSRSRDRRHRRSRNKKSDRRHRRSSSSSDSISSDRSNTKSKSTSPDSKCKRSRSRSTEMEFKKSRSRKSESLEKHGSKHNIELNDLYMTPVPQNSSLNLQKDTNQFSVLGACQLLMGFCDKIGYLGHSLRAALNDVQHCGNNSSKIIKSLIDSEGQELLGLIAGKLKSLGGGTQDIILLSKYNQALIATNFLLKHIEFYLDISELDLDRSENTRNKITESNIDSFGSNLINNSSSAFNSDMNDINRSHKNVNPINYESSNVSGSSHNTGSDQLTSEEVLLLQKLLGKKKEHVLSSSLYTSLQKSLTTQDSHTYIQESHTQRELQMEPSSRSTFTTPPAISNMLKEVGEAMGLNTDLKYDQHSRNQMF